jgi:hypothetical protein
VAANPDDLSLTGTLVADGRSARLAYEVTNKTVGTIYLFNVLHLEFDEASYPIDPAGCYVEVRNGRVILSKKIIEPPDGVDVETPNIPFVTRLLRGQTFAETVTLALPLKAHTPYDDSPEPAEQARVVRLPADFELGYFVGTVETDGLARSQPTGNGTSLGFDVFPAGSQRIARLQRLGDLPVVGG